MNAARDGRAPTILSGIGARRLTNRIRESLQTANSDLIRAWEGRAWEALNHATWESYLDAEFGEILHIRLPIDVRRDRVADMRRAGMSQRAIAAALGVSVGTVAADFAFLGPLDDGAVVISLDRSRRARQHPRRVAPVATEPPLAMTKRDRAVQLVAEQGNRGLTVKELCLLTDWPQTTASGTLTPLERQGRVRRSETRRLGCAAYIAAPPTN